MKGRIIKKAVPEISVVEYEKRGPFDLQVKMLVRGRGRIVLIQHFFDLALTLALQFRAVDIFTKLCRKGGAIQSEPCEKEGLLAERTANNENK